jgi:hypothetical protein
VHSVHVDGLIAEPDGRLADPLQATLDRIALEAIALEDGPVDPFDVTGDAVAIVNDVD